MNSNGPRNLGLRCWRSNWPACDEIGGPNTHSNFPHGWAMAANTPLRRYKQNTHGGGIRDPLVLCWPRGIASRGELRHQFAHACDVVPTLLDLLGIEAPQQINGVTQMPLEGMSFAASIQQADAPSKSRPQYFEMFGHRGVVASRAGRRSRIMPLERPMMQMRGSCSTSRRIFRKPTTWRRRSLTSSPP